MNLSATDDEIRDVVDRWVTLLAQEDYERAFALTRHDAYFGWTPKLIESVINGYGLPEPHPSGEVFRVTDPKTAKGGPVRAEVEREDGPEGCRGRVYYDLPLNGEWSDLTAIFRLEHDREQLVVVLEEIHVL
jgi:hypothetical protein